MARYSDIFRDTITQKPIAGALVTVTDYAGKLATLTQDGGSPLPNPFTTGDDGAVVFNTADGKYDITYSYGGRIVSEIKGEVVGDLIIAVAPSPSNAGKFVALDASGSPIYASGTGADSGLRTDLSASSGASLIKISSGATLQSYISSLSSSAGSSGIGFLQSGTGAIYRTTQAKLRDWVHVRDFGAVGNNVTDDTAALAAAINYCQAQTFPPLLDFGSGFYKTGPLPQITKPITLIGDSPRTCALTFSGSVDAITVKGSGTRAAAVNFRNLSLVGNSMTSGYLVNIDWAQDILFDNVVFNNPYNGVYVRQCGNIQLTNCLMDYVRGAVGLDMYGSNTTRNGENDQIDVVILSNTVIQSNLPAVGGSNSSVLMRLDGRVHTIQCDGLRLLNGGVGLQTKNTPALASNLVPRFLFGSTLEVENCYAECLDLQAFREFKPSSLFAVGSHTADGVKLSSAVYDFAPVRANISSNFLHGLNVNGAASVRLNKPTIYNNALVGVSQKSGVYVSGSGLVEIEGGLCGKETSLPAYTEPQKYGIELDAAFNGIVLARGVDLRNNATGAFYDPGTSATGSRVAGCPGYNPRGTASASVGSSPATIVAGLTQEVWHIVGTGISVNVGGTTLALPSTGGAFTLNPRLSAVITYSTLTSATVTRG